MHEKALPAGSRRLLERLKTNPPPVLRGWTLAGGTGLALQRGHRLSEDFDFFRIDEADVRGLHRAVKAASRYETLQEAEHTLTVLAEGVKLSFFQAADPFLFAGKPYLFFHVAAER